jgi:hypothetical protein
MTDDLLHLSTKDLGDADKVDASVDAAMEYIGACGMDGSQPYPANFKGISLCPAFILNSLEVSGGNLASLSLVLGHEAGHDWDMNGVAPYGDEIYAKFEACFAQASGGAASFWSKGEALRQFKKALPLVQAEIRSEEAKSPRDDRVIAWLRNKEQILAEELDEDIEGEIDAPRPNDGDVLSAHFNEIVADYFGVRSLVGELKNAAPAERAGIVRGSLDLFCDQDPDDDLEQRYSSMIEGNMKTDGEHPPADMRIQMIFRDRELREMLGCPALAAGDTPACGIGGPDPAPTGSR